MSDRTDSRSSLGRSTLVSGQGIHAVDVNTAQKSARFRLLNRLFSISRATRTLMGYKMAEIGIHAGQDELLLSLVPDAPLRVSHLADAMQVRAPTVSRMLNRLAVSGLVERVKDPSDHRRTVVRITPAGTEVQCRIREVRQWLENEFQAMPDRDRAEQDLARVDETLRVRLSRLR